ncbi:hypothetical protein BDZ97DRAFT_706037 [Flammula alnicola]|nr:hypothetical protein BDZ97DRAFT_706037 [Flammula alnicola]
MRYSVYHSVRLELPRGRSNSSYVSGTSRHPACGESRAFHSLKPLGPMSSNLALPISDNAAPVWPRRASKACASCRRDKIRCDGSRPCSGCKKKGYAADQCTDGCEQCRRARLRCEDGRPCRRCVDMRIECSDSTTLSVQRPFTPPPPGTQQQKSAATGKSATTRGSDRAKLACSNCRRDNKKCEDQRPCSRCIARSEECIHLLRGPKLVKLRCEGCRLDNKRCEEKRPCQYCIEGHKECITAPRKGRGHGTRVKAACMSCRRDKIRCNGDRPCASCVKKGCECIERACQTCSRDGRATECTHRGRPDAGLSDSGDTMVKGNDYRPSGLFQTLRTSTLVINGQELPQWASHVPGPHSHPLHPMHPTMMPQPQYYFPPQQTGHSMQPAFPMVAHPAVIPGPGSQTNYYYNDFSRSGTFMHTMASSSRTIPRDN